MKYAEKEKNRDAKNIDRQQNSCCAGTISKRYAGIRPGAANQGRNCLHQGRQIRQDFRGSSGQLSFEKSDGTGNDHLLFCRISQNSTGSSANSGTHAARRYRRLLCQHGSLLQSRRKPKLQRDDTGNCTDGQPVCGE